MPKITVGKTNNIAKQSPSQENCSVRIKNNVGGIMFEIYINEPTIFSEYSMTFEKFDFSLHRSFSRMVGKSQGHLKSFTIDIE